MPRLTAALIFENTAPTLGLIESLAASDSVERVILIAAGRQERMGLSEQAMAKIFVTQGDFPSGPSLARLINESATDYLLLILPGEQVRLGARALDRFLSVATDSGAGLVYSDFKDELGESLSDHPLIDYQDGSIRDSFDFGSIMLISKRAADKAARAHGEADQNARWAGLYDLRLKLSIDSKITRIPEPLYSRVPSDRRASGERQFDYVDPRRRDYQREMEDVATAHLKRAGAYLAPDFKSLRRVDERFRVRASVIIPVRNRERTIREAVESALSQKAPFDFNVIVVDNHSTDRTTEILSDLSREDKRLVHLRPERTDLGIGGCWNEAVYSSHCGEHAVQLDSDDLYADERTLEKIIAKFDEGNYAMVIGSYTIVNFDLEEIPPGLIDHREWTRENGRNNALRINGLGAPRAFYVPALREIGLPNTSYGEDYAAALRVSRDYEIGRIYESIYFARRWEGNSDAQLPLAQANRYDAYKDYLRTVEILARKRANQQ
ncbi:MAG TPA: glycosyltransferase family 2 protein [Blastocatellia bacterium]|nr:glycosyltransferase family 2 protein [Blastocatellia bacterium]